MNIAILNGSLTAGQKTPIDVLMKLMGLLIINHMDNIFGNLFLMLRTKGEKEDDLLNKGLERRDKVFARWLSFPHLILVVVYGLWFLGAFQYENPEEGLVIIVLF